MKGSVNAVPLIVVKVPDFHDGIQKRTRASFWKGREEELHNSFKEIAANSDILIGNEEDFQLCLGIQGPPAGGEGLDQKIDGFKEMIERIKQAYPSATAFATTLREVINVNSHLWGGIVNCGNEWEVIKPREIGVMDRIGGGDGFVDAEHGYV